MRGFLLALLLMWTGAALADGFYVPRAKSSDLVKLEDLSSPDQHAVLVDRGDEQELIIRVVVRGATDEFAWVLPIPSAPLETPEALVQGDDLFAYLYSVTAPEWREAQDVRGGRFDCGSSASSSLAMSGSDDGVELLGREVVGDLVVATLGASSGVALEDWLNDNGFAVPAGLSEKVQSYVENNWVFLAMKVAPGFSEDARLQVLRIRFKAAQPVFPLYLTSLNSAGGKTPVTLFIFSDSRVDVPGMETAFAGQFAAAKGNYYGRSFEYADVAIGDDTIAAELLNGLDGYWLTRLQDSYTGSQMEDLYPEPVESEPYREIRYYSAVSPQLPARHAGLLAVLLLSAAALALLRFAVQFGDRR